MSFPQRLYSGNCDSSAQEAIRGGVHNAACEAHEVKGLFVADSSTFCSSGSAPFTLTIMANALRVATGIAQRMRRREL